MIELGKYATSVLGAYGVSLALLGGLIWQTLAANARARRDLEVFLLQHRLEPLLARAGRRAILDAGGGQ